MRCKYESCTNERKEANNIKIGYLPFVLALQTNYVVF